MRVNASRRGWIIALACVACVAGLVVRATIGVCRYIVTPRPSRTYTSPDGLYRCVVYESPWDEFGLGNASRFRVQDASGRVLAGGDFGDTYVVDVLWYDDRFVAQNAEAEIIGGICHHGRIYSQSEIATLTSDNDLAELADCKNLHDVTIRGPGVTDAGLARLHHCKGLVTLCLDRAGVTIDGLRSLHQALPNLKIFDRPAATQPVSIEQ